MNQKMSMCAVVVCATILSGCAGMSTTDGLFGQKKKVELSHCKQNHGTILVEPPETVMFKDSAVATVREVITKSGCFSTVASGDHDFVARFLMKDTEDMDSTTGMVAAAVGTLAFIPMAGAAGMAVTTSQQIDVSMSVARADGGPAIESKGSSKNSDISFGVPLTMQPSDGSDGKVFGAACIDAMNNIIPALDQKLGSTLLHDGASVPAHHPKHYKKKKRVH
ncbi:MAG: hypothetical protein ACYC8S_01425 [Minisyncoccota bacterium]